MKPTFALNITDDGFVLLHRTAKGWTNVGETTYSAPDLPEAMAYLRKTALGLAPKGVSTKLVIPNSQILYTEVEAPGPSDSARRKQIAAALAGRTPYEVADLVFDWSGKGPAVQVVAVAKETLREAEAFAVEHRLNPLSFVAIPEPGAFDGEPYFGMTAFAPSHLKSGETVERDLEPILPLSRTLPKAEVGAPPPVAEKSQPSVAEQTAAPAAARPAQEPIVPDHAPYIPALEEPSNGIERALAAQRSGSDRPSGVAPASPAAPPASPAVPAPVAPAAGPVEPAALAASLTAPAAPQQRPEAVPEAPFAEVPEPLPAPDFDDVPDMPGAPPRGGLPDDVPPAPASSIRMAFASRRAGAEGTVPAPSAVPSSVAPVGAAAVGRPAGGAVGVPPPIGAAAGSRIVRDKPVEDLPPLNRSGFAAPKPAAAPGRSGVAKSFGALVSVPGMPGSKKKAKVAAAPLASAPASTAGATVGTQGAAATRPMQPTKALTKPGGTFGTPPKRNKPRYLGLILTALLLVFLGLVAAWSSFYLSSDEAPSDSAVAAGGSIAAPDAVDPQTAATLDSAEVPAVEDEMLADGEEPLGPQADELLAGDLADTATALPEGTAEAGAQADAADLALSTSEAPPAADPEAEAVAAAVSEAADGEADVTQATAAALPEPAPGTAVTSDSPAAATLTEDQDEIFLAGNDTPPPALDALALPLPEMTGDPPPGAQAPPPPFGTVYQFDDRGLIRPTPEGIMTPEGVMLFAGAPPLLPPERPQSVSDAAAAVGAAAAAAIPAAAVPADANAPDTAAPLPVADPALSGFRPRTRPEGLAPAAVSPPSADDASAPVDPATMTASLRPRSKPAAVISASEAARQQSEAASLTAQAAAQEAALAAASNDPSNPSLLAISRRPAARPQDFSRAVDAAVQLAVAEAVREPDPQAEAAAPLPEDDEEPEVASAAPSVPLKGTVAKQATFVNALNLSKVNLIGVYGTDARRYALIRQSNGRFKKVQVGDRFDGGQVAAITASEVRYEKGGRLVSLKLPRG